MEKNKSVKNYASEISAAYDEIVAFIVKNNLNRPLKIANITLKEIKMTGKTVKREVDVVDEMFIYDDEEQPVKEMLSSLKVSNDKDEYAIEEEIPVVVVNKNLQKSLESQRQKDLIKGLRNDRKPNILTRMKKYLSNNETV